MAAAKVLIEGYLDKLGGALKRTPQTRYVVVEGTSLTYYKDFKENADGTRAKPQGVLTLVGAVFEELPEVDGVFPFVMKLLHGKKEHYEFQCYKADDRARWLTALRSKDTGAAPSATSDSKGTGRMYDDSLREGDLWKYEQKTGWQKLHCVLLPEVFLAYTDRAAQPKRLPLGGVSIVPAPAQVPDNKPHAFLLRKENKDAKISNFFLAANSTPELVAWMKSILEALDGASGTSAIAAAKAAKPKPPPTAAAAAAAQAEADIKKEADQRTKAIREQNEKKAAEKKKKEKEAAQKEKEEKEYNAKQKARKGGLLGVLVSALEDESTKSAGIDGAARKRLASALKKQKQKIDSDDEKKKRQPRRPRTRSSFSVRRSFCDQFEGFYGSWQIKQTDDLTEYWSYLGVPLPLRLILMSDPSERVTFEGDGEALTIKTRCALFAESVGHDPRAGASGGGAGVGGGDSGGDRHHMVPHRWYDLVTFRGSICLKQMFWDDNEDDHLVLTFNTRLENKIGLVTEDFRLSDDGDTLLHRMVLKTAEKEPRTITFRRQWQRLLANPMSAPAPAAAAPATAAPKPKLTPEEIKKMVEAKREALKKEADAKAKAAPPKKDTTRLFGVHTEITCDGCNVKPIVGFRYKCTHCANHDFCEECYAVWQKGELRHKNARNPVSKRVEDHVWEQFVDPAAFKAAMDSTKKEQPKTNAGKAKAKPNDPCPCGSKKKFKKCCGEAKAGDAAATAAPAAAAAAAADGKAK